MHRIIPFFLLAFCWATLADGQEKAPKEKPKKGKLYFAGGSHRIFYTPSTIHINRGGTNPADFTLEKVKGRDEGGLRWKTAPQFSYTVGYYFTEKNFGIEYHYDHIKYFVTQNQRVRLKGSIGDQQYNQDTLLVPDFFQLEHSDGGNYGMFNIVKWVPLAANKTQSASLSLLLKAGLGFVNPKTNSRITGQHRDDKYHLSGYVAGLESGFRLTIGKTFFATGTFKGAYANYDDFLISGGRGKQQWFSAQFNYLVGAQFSL
jgi:hypothetical protein